MTTSADPTIYEGRIDLGNQNNSHTIAFRFIHERLGEGHGRILEVGCNTGYFGEALIKAGHHVTGVELSPSAGLEAYNRLSAVFIGSVEDFLSSEEFKDERYDCITFGDVLEHIYDPVAVLAAAGTRLRDEGIVVISVPNITHIAIRTMVLGGRWVYSDRGIMDRTHVRFFDKQGTIGLLEDAGLNVEAIASVRVPASETGVQFSQTVFDCLSQQTADAAAEVFQYISVARRTHKIRKFEISHRHVLVLWPVAEWALGDIRLRAPLSSWSEIHGGDVRYIPYGSCRDVDVEWADVIVIQRESSPLLLYKIRQWRAMGKAVIFDIDDLLIDVPPFLQSYAHYKSVSALIKAALVGSNQVTTTTERLGLELSKYAQAVSVTPNCSQHWGPRASHSSSSNQVVKLIIASSDTVRLDFVVPALEKLLADESINVEILAIGQTVDFLKNAGLTVSGIPLLSYPEFLSFVAQQDNAIGIIPLDDSKFSSCKSPIKFLDYACCGIPSVCSNVPPYSDVIHDGLDGMLVANEVNAWYQTVRQLVLEPERRKAISSAAYAMANERFALEGVANTWQIVIESAIAHAHQHPVAPESKLNISMRRLQRLLTLAASSSSYPRIVKMVWREGITGLIRRVWQ